MRGIKGYEHTYAIAPDGRVWSYRSKKWVKPHVNKGYWCIHTRIGGKYGKNVYLRIHRCVAEAYLLMVIN